MKTRGKFARRLGRVLYYLSKGLVILESLFRIGMAVYGFLMIFDIPLLSTVRRPAPGTDVILVTAQSMFSQIAYLLCVPILGALIGSKYTLLAHCLIYPWFWILKYVRWLTAKDYDYGHVPRESLSFLTIQANLGMVCFVSSAFMYLSLSNEEASKENVVQVLPVQAKRSRSVVRDTEPIVGPPLRA